MNDILHIGAPLLTFIGSIISFSFAIRAYRLKAKLVRTANEKMAQSDSPVVEDEAVDPDFESDSAINQKDIDDA